MKNEGDIDMKKRKLALLLIATIGVLTVLSGCGSKEDSIAESAKGEIEDVAEENAFGARSLEEYPISDDTKTKLEALTTDYSKVNWEVEYEPKPGIVVSEGTFVKTTSMGSENYIVVAFTNLTGNHVSLSLKGYIEDEDGKVVKDIIKDDLEIWDGNTVAREVNLNYANASGNIRWDNITIGALDREYVDFAIHSELTTNAYDQYYIASNLEKLPEHDSTKRFSQQEFGACGLVLDKDGNILYGQNAGAFDSGAKGISMAIESFGGENADVAYFCNPYL